MDSIYLIDTKSKTAAVVSPVSLAKCGLSERADLEEWILNHPDLLGEPLLVVTSEFDQFDRSNRRLDVLALDRQGTIVVVELKLDAARSLADLQALRYAAFCSTMTMQDVVFSLADSHGVTPDEAERRIIEFLEVEELSEPDRPPRIILAAGSFNHSELASCVLWLRGFGVDISCVELTPYAVQGISELVVVPRTLIPLPEARDYVVRVERKEAARKRAAQGETRFSHFWQLVTDGFNAKALAVDGRSFRVRTASRGRWQTVPIGHGSVHYEWILRLSCSALDVALHFESADYAENEAWLTVVRENCDAVAAGIEHDFSAAKWGKGWAEVRFRIHVTEVHLDDQADEAVFVMCSLIERTYPLLKKVGIVG